MLSSHGFDTQFFGGSPVVPPSLKGRVLRLAKKVAVTSNLIPGSMRGKRWLKRLVFGKLVTMPSELLAGDVKYVPPVPLDGRRPDAIHQVLYCVAKVR